MIAKSVALSSELHKDLKVLPTFSVEIFRDRHIAPIMLQEFTAAASFYPIFFLEIKGEFAPVTVFGLKEGQNLFLKDDKWEGRYIPASLRAYPFSLAQTNDDQLLLCVNEAADNVSKTEGQALFNEDATPTEFFEGINKYFKDYIEANAVSRNILSQMKEMGLFKADALQYKINGTDNRLDGFYVIDREKFEALTDEQFLALRKFGVLPAIYAHISSLERITDVIARIPAETPAAS